MYHHLFLSYQQSTEYEIVLGRKNVAVKLIITFDKKDCFHLMGLQDYIYYTIEKRCKIARLPDGKYLFHQAILCKHFFSFDYSADSLETEFFFFLDLPEIIL